MRAGGGSGRNPDYPSAHPSDRVIPTGAAGNAARRDVGCRTRKEVEEAYGCSGRERCIRCRKNGTCTAKAAESFRRYWKKRDRWLDIRFRCGGKGTRCELNACPEYLICARAEKENYKKWIDAYKQGRKDVLEKLCERGT